MQHIRFFAVVGISLSKRSFFFKGFLTLFNDMTIQRGPPGARHDGPGARPRRCPAPPLHRRTPPVLPGARPRGLQGAALLPRAVRGI